MAPEIYVYGKKIADVPDETGIYKTLEGNIISVNTDLIDADAKKQTITLESDEIGGRRVLGLTQQGIGKSNDRKRGDNLLPNISVALIDRPIRISYKDRLLCERMRTLGGPNGMYYVMTKRTYKNPRWMRGHGQR